MGTERVPWALRGSRGCPVGTEEVPLRAPMGSHLQEGNPCSFLSLLSLLLHSFSDARSRLGHLAVCRELPPGPGQVPGTTGTRGSSLPCLCSAEHRTPSSAGPCSCPFPLRAVDL